LFIASPATPSAFFIAALAAIGVEAVNLEEI
jgi:hypothetical protein